jgi:phage-related protein
LANSIATAYVQVVPTTDGIRSALSKEFGDAGDTAGKSMGGGILGAAKSFIGPLAAIFAAGAIVNFGKSAIEEASNLTESLNAVKVSFGDASAEITRLGEDSATRLGLSQSAFNGIATQFSAFASTIAGSGGDVAGVIDQLSTRGADFASVFNLEVSDALGLFQSGLAGETEPLRKYGIDLSAAAVEAYAMANGIGESGRQLTEAEKVQARYGLLLESTNKTAGDFANTADGLANSQRISNARFADASAALGNSLLPIIQTITVALADTFVPILETVGAWFAENPTVITAVAVALGIMATAIGAIVLVQWLWNAALAASPITWIIIGITALIAAIVWLILNWENVVAFLSDVFNPAIEAVGAIFTWLWENAIKPVVDGISMAFTWLYETILVPIFQGVMLYIGIWAAIFTFLYENVIKPVFGFIGQMFTWLYENVVKPVIGFIVKTIENLGKVFTWLYNNIVKPVFDGLGAAFEWVWKNVIQPVIGFITGAIENIGKVVSTVFGAISGFIKDTFDGIINIIRGPVNAVIGFINTLISGLNKIKIDIPDWVPEWGGKTIGFNIAKIPMLAEGGNITGSGTVMVGERGPELLTLPKGAQVTPLDRAGGNTIVYNAAPNVSFDAEESLFQAMRRSRVVAGWG